MPKPSTCIECMEEGPVVDPRPPEQRKTLMTIAQFEGRCPSKFGCGEPIRDGQIISLLEPAQVWVHENCNVTG
ncbi:MAG: hypothetical protein ACRD8W_00375 [Nitrososphaeraceae archaeon]